MVLENPEIFYNIFPYKYWLFKGEQLNFLLKSDGEFFDSDGNLSAFGADKKEFFQMIKFELHFTYYHQAESFFELIFAFQKIDSKNIWINLSNNEKGKMYDFIKKIDKINRDSAYLKNISVPLTNGNNISFYEYLLYDTLRPQTNISDKELSISLEKLDDIIQFAANDLSDKGEYNAFKHGMRVLPLWKDFSVFESGTENKIFDVDLTNSFTYLFLKKEKEKEKRTVQEITKGYSPEQDLLKIKLLTMAMSAFIESRKMKYFKEGKIIRFREFDFIKKLNEIGPKFDNLIFSNSFTLKENK